MLKPVLALIVLLLVVVGQVSGVAHLFVVNGVSDLRGDSRLNIYINGSQISSRLRYGQGVGYLKLPPGLVTVQARLSASTGPPYGYAQMSLHDDYHYVLVASGSMRNRTQFPLELSGGPFGQGSNHSLATVAAFNVAPGAPALSLSVDDQTLLPWLAYLHPWTVTQPQIQPGIHFVSLKDAQTSKFLLTSKAQLQAGLNFVFVLGDYVGGEKLSCRVIQPSPFLI